MTEKGRKFRNQIIIDLAPELQKITAQLPPDKVSSLVGELVEIRKVLGANRDPF